MNKISFNIQNVTITCGTIALLPRIIESPLSDAVVAIILFWLTMIVILPECIKDFEKPVSLKLIPKSTKVVLSLIILYSLCSCFLINKLYSEESNLIEELVRKTIFLFHPIICLSWIFYRKTNKSKLLKFVTLTFFAYSISLILIHANKTLPSEIKELLTHSTTLVSAKTLELFTNSEIIFLTNSYIFESHKVVIHGGCAGFPQIGMVFQSLATFWICCPIKNKNYLFITFLASLLIAFLINTVRISILGVIISKHGEKSFEFWHGGVGSLIFSLISITLSSLIYYSYWCKENPIKK